MMKQRTIKSIGAVAMAMGGVAVTSIASAHLVLESQLALAGSIYKAIFRVGHGCGNSPTRQIAVDIPRGVRAARPMPKPGWALEIQREQLSQPYTSHGRTVSEDVVRVIWTAKTKDDVLPNAQYDEFVLVAQLPDKAGLVYWPVRQVCEAGRNDWVEIPTPSQKLSDLKAPAVLLEIRPTGVSSDHKH